MKKETEISRNGQILNAVPSKVTGVGGDIIECIFIDSYVHILTIDCCNMMSHKLASMNDHTFKPVI